MNKTKKTSLINIMNYISNKVKVDIKLSINNNVGIITYDPNYFQITLHETENDTNVQVNEYSIFSNMEFYVSFKQFTLDIKSGEFYKEIHTLRDISDYINNKIKTLKNK